MTPTVVRRPNRVQGSLLWAATGAAVAVHALAVLLYVLTPHEEAAPRASHQIVEPEPPEEIALETTCAGDARLAAAARAVLCFAPWTPDARACVDELDTMMRIDLSSCRARNDESIASVAMVPQAQVEKVPPIDPEQLIEELEELEKPKPPPPQVPPPQPQQQPPPPPPPPPPPRPPLQAQIVETVKPPSEKEPENARFLSEHNTSVEKQTVARGAASEVMVAKSKPEELKPKEQPPKEDPAVAKPPAEDKLPGTDDRAPDVRGKLSMRAPGAPALNQETPQEARMRGAFGGAKGPLAADGFVPRSGDAAIEQQRRDPGEKTKGQNGAGGGAPRVPDLKPKEVLERLAGGGSVDHLEEVENGEETALNSKAFLYATFMNRVKRQVAMAWDPQTVWRQVDPTGRHNGYKTRVTLVRVTLSAKGDLTKIVVLTPSGVTELDDEALRSFRAAGPFPNPPEGMVKDNQVTFPFGFYFSIAQSSATWKIRGT
jgi:TonB family protein